MNYQKTFFEKHFREIRSLGAKERLSDIDFLYILRVSEKALAISKTIYTEKWLPYLTYITKDASLSQRTMIDLKEYQKATKTIPSLFWNLTLTTIDDVNILMTQEEPHNIDSLTINLHGKGYIESDFIIELLNKQLSKKIKLIECHFTDEKTNLEIEKITYTSVEFRDSSFDDEFLIKIIDALDEDYLEKFALSSTEAGDKTLRFLAYSKSFSKLTDLDISHNNNNMGEESLLTLSQPENFPSLQKLNISGIRNTSKSSRQPRHIESLIMDCMDPEDCDLFKTINFFDVNKLSELSLDGSEINDEKLIDIFGSMNPENLTNLNLSGNKMSATGIKYLSNVKLFPSLVKLNLSSTNLDNESLLHLSHSQNFPSLKSLDIMWNSLDGNGIIHLASSKTINNLSFLDISYNKSNDDSIIALSQSSNFKELEHLNISNSFITEKGFLTLMHSENFPALNTLLANKLKLKKIATQELFNSHIFTRVKHLELCENREMELERSPLPKKVKIVMQSLALSFGSLGDDLLNILASELDAPYLKKLGVQAIDLTDDCLPHVDQILLSGSIEDLNISANTIQLKDFNKLSISQYKTPLHIDFALNHIEKETLASIENHLSETENLMLTMCFAANPRTW